MTEHLSILLISGEYPPAVGGVGDYTQQLGRTLSARGHQLQVLTTQGRAGPDADPPVLAVAPGWGWRAWHATVRCVARLSPDIVHIQYQTGAYAMHPAINLLPWRLRQLRPRPAIVVTLHDLRLPYLLPKADRARAWVTTRLCADADAVIVTNAADARALGGGVAPSRDLYSPTMPVMTPLSIIPIGSNIMPAPPPDYDRAAWRRQLGCAPDDVLIGYFGLLSRTKGVLELLAALARLPASGPRRYRLLIIGGAAPLPDDQRYAAEIERFIDVHELGARVQLTGSCAAEEVSAHLLAADMVVLPFADGASYRRGSLLAALAHARPTITTAPAAPLDPPLLDGQHALLLPDAAPERLQAAIQRVAADPELQIRLSTGALDLAAAFAWPSIASEHETVYHTVQKAVAKKAHA